MKKMSLMSKKFTVTLIAVALISFSAHIYGNVPVSDYKDIRNTVDNIIIKPMYYDEVEIQNG